MLGLDVATDGPAIRERVGYMPEHDCLPPDVSATEFVVHMARMSGLPTTAARERTADTLRHVGLYEERYRPIGGYSTGMKQRVKLAQALVHDPELVLLDEPTNGLDPAGRDDMLGADPPDRHRVRHLGARHLAPARRARAGLRPRRGHRRRPAAAVAPPPPTSPPQTPAGRGRGRRRPGRAASPGWRRPGVGVAADGRLLEVDLVDDATYDVVRDAVAELGLGPGPDGAAAAPHGRDLHRPTAERGAMPD